MSKDMDDTKNISRNPSRDSVKHILLKGVFWRILIIEGVLLVWSVFYMLITEASTGKDLLWYILRIVVLVGIIILFMMVSLKSFLTRKVITSLEAIDQANRNLRDDDLVPGRSSYQSTRPKKSGRLQIPVNRCWTPSSRCPKSGCVL